MRECVASVRKVAPSVTPTRHHYATLCLAEPIIYCLTIEPGVCLPEFGVKLEIDIHSRDNDAVITGERQDEIVHIQP